VSNLTDEKIVSRFLDDELLAAGGTIQGEFLWQDDD
jgi:hypothetical protein